MNVKLYLSELSLNTAFSVKEILGLATFNPLKCERKRTGRRRRKNKNNSKHKNKKKKKERDCKRNIHLSEGKTKFLRSHGFQVLFVRPNGKNRLKTRETFAYVINLNFI